MPTNFGTELYLSTGSPNKVSEAEAILQQIQNLLFIKKGTYPNDPDLGMGIEDDQFELMDNDVLTNFNLELDRQIDKYIITDYIIQTRVSFKYVNAITYQKVLVIEIFVGPNQKDLSTVSFLITRAPETNKIKFSILR